MKKNHFCMLALSLGTLGVGTAQELRMTPPIIEIMTTPASTQTFYVSLSNESEDDVDCRMEIRSMALSEQGMPMPADSAARSCAAWTSQLGESSFQLKAHETKPIQFTLRPPLNTEPGGYYAMVATRAVNPRQLVADQTKAQATIRIHYQMASVVMLVVRGANIQAKIMPEAPTIFGGNRAGAEEERNWYVEVPIRNNGNIHVALAGDVKIMSDAGQLLRQQALIAGRGYLMPDQRRVFKAEGTGPLPDGLYIANVQIGKLDADQTATESIPFYILRGQVLPGRPDTEKSKSLEETSQGFILDKNSMAIEAAAGGRRTQMVQVVNVTDREFSVTANLLAWDQSINGDIVFPEKSKHGRELGANITISPAQFILKPKGKMPVKIICALPKESEGEYFDAVRFQRLGTQKSQEATLLQQQSVLTSIRVNKAEKPAAKLEKFTPQPVKNKGMLFSMLLNNTGNVSVSPVGRVSIFDAENARLGDPINFGEGSFLLPNNSRVYNIEWNRILPPGRYRAEVSIEYDILAKPLREEYPFVVQ